MGVFESSEEDDIVDCELEVDDFALDKLVESGRAEVVVVLGETGAEGLGREAKNQGFVDMFGKSCQVYSSTLGYRMAVRAPFVGSLNERKLGNLWSGN